jgi:hypothetical protein
MITLDKDHDIPVYSSVCTFCKHLRLEEGRTCRAFPKANSIPLDIWNGKNKHTKPYPGDNGIQFEKVKIKV